jgi:hypothetical protein
MACFCCHGISSIAFRRGRGTMLLSGWLILQVDKACKRQWRRVVVQALSKAENCHGAECLLHTNEGDRVPGSILIPADGSASCKKCDKLITPTIRVTNWAFLSSNGLRYFSIQAFRFLCL